ncbi:MAG: NAD(P)-dependent oxidoreductase [Candidatus Shapirobacteria bacterium]|nr:NAD(P)-dependent oxidoreductase [Candidatus Shapirobacteria bacterium]MDD3003166.1 NAD(P)-dependent oxidoreductase [Candidatus Shapirobacteria bacterium]MDD4382819.1 NAD(P)-dependent oxidoreductase [Candidatus Shapirobacteria bacterium]
MEYNQPKADLRIAFFGVKSWEREIIEKEIGKLDSFGIGIFEGEVQDNLELAAKYDIISPFIYSIFDKESLCKLPNLKMIAARSTGIDNVDIGECNKRKIVVANVPVYGSKTVAEYTFALMLAITRKIVEAHQSVENGEFSPEGLTGVDLDGKILGVIGVGNIGQNVVRIARAFGMKVLGVDERLPPEVAKKIGCKIVDLETCLKEADIVTLHVPSIPETFHLINKKNIKLMKKGSYLVNTSRGPVIETEAIVWALNNKTLAGAALDVTEDESMLESVSVVMSKKITKDELQDVLSFHLLRDRDDVIFTPHNAFNTKEAIGRIVGTTVENIKKFMEGVNN